MDWFKVTLKLKSPTGTPWQADTLFGHLCWALAHQDGEEELKHFLQPFLDGKPTFLLSDGFPPGFLPRPLAFKLPEDDTEEQFNMNRSIRKLTFFTEIDFRRAIKGEAFKLEDNSAELKKGMTTRAVLKNQLSRLTGTTGDDGNLYGFIEHWMPEVVIYGKAREGSEEPLKEIKELFQNLRRSGYGKRKAVGYGAIDDIDFDDRFEGFRVPDGANGFVTLSAFVPVATDPTEGQWRIRVKYGRLGEEYAFSDNPFKKPLVMLTPGSVFYDTPMEEYYGCMVKDVSVNAGVVHYGYALPVPLKLPVLTE